MQNQAKSHTLHRAFTIVELVIVVAVIGILATVTTVGYGAWRDETVKSQLKSDLTNAASAMENVRNFDNGYPATLPSISNPSSDVTLTLFASTSSTFCINATSATNPTLQYFIDETHESTGVQEGVCSLAIPNEQIAKLVASDAAVDNFFGYAVSLSGDTAVFSAQGYDGVGLDSDSGAAYVFTRSGSTWTQQAKLTASDAGANDYFGLTVSVSGDTTVIGAYGNDDAGTNSGAAYVFTRSGSTWTQQAKLTASDAGVVDNFGTAVSTFGNTTVIGAQGDNTDTGSAYVFTRSGSTWTQQAKLTASDAATGDIFGSQVSLSGDTVMIGAQNDDDAGTNSGAAYVFTRSGSTWTQQAKLTASDAAMNDLFGSIVSVSEDSAVIGARGDNTSTGAAYVFTRSGSTWTQQAKLTASDAAIDDYFGAAAALSADTVIVGAQRNDDAGTNSGSAYVFTRSGSTWTQQAKLTASDATTLFYFGTSVAISGNTGIIGARGNNHAGRDSGAAYIFD